MLPLKVWSITALAISALALPVSAQTSDPEAAPTPPVAEPPAAEAPIEGEVTGEPAAAPAVAPAAQSTKPANADGTTPIDIPPPGAPGSEITLDDWDRDDWTLVKPAVQLFELHGYFRTRGDLMRRLDFGNHSGTELSTNAGTNSSGNTLQSRYPNSSGDSAGYTQTNMRFRLEPTINVSEKVQIVSMVDVLDNIGYGSNPSTFPFDTDNADRSTPNSLLNMTQLSPITDVNALTDSIRVKRVYARITALNEQLEFKIGRQPNHWGLGMLYNDGNCLDCDYGQNVDRIAATLRIAGLLVTPMLDWVSSGPTFAPFYRYDGQAMDGTTWDDIPEYAVRIQRLTHPDDIREETLQGHTVLDFGFSNAFRRQSADLNSAYYSDRDTGTIQFDPAYPIQGTSSSDTTSTASRRESRNAFLYTGDAYLKLYMSHFEFNIEASVRAGRFRDTNTSATGSLETTTLTQIGGAFELSYWPDDRRRGPRLMLRGGGASGDSYPGWGALDQADSQRGARSSGTSYDRTLNNFNFSPDYHVDLLMFRRIIGTVTDAWYVAPEARYFFNDQVEGRLRTVYSQAFFKSTTPGGNLPMGLEFDGELHLGSPPEGEKSGLRGVLQGGIAFPFGAFNNNSSSSTDNPKFAWTLQYRLYIVF